MAVGTSNYPASLDTVVELVEAANNAADTLNGGIDAIVTTLTVNDASEFAASGIVAIDDELVSYTGKSGNDLTGLTRGIEGTLAASHSSGADVRQVITASSHNVQSAAIIALETKLGTGTDIAWSQMVPLTANRLVVTDGTGDVTASPITHDATNAILGNVGGIDFDTTPTGTVQAARLQWNDTDGTLDLGLKGGAVTLQVGQEHLTRIVNKTGDDLLESEFRVIRAGASAGVNRIGGYLAQANTEANSTDVLGIVTENIAKNQEGFVTTWGEVRQVDTTGAVYGETWNEGDTLYLSPNTYGGKAGALTNVKPKGPNHLVIVGYVVSKNANNGRILVHVQSSWETNELHDVNITGTPSAGQLLIRDATTNVWKNANLTAGTNVTITNADGAITINATSSGDVAGPASSTHNALARFDGTTGKLIQNSNVTLSDTGAFSFPDGVRQTFNPNGTNAGINVGAHTSDPSGATNGDLWYNSASNLLKTRRGGASEIVATIPTTAGVDEIAIVGGSGGGLTSTTDLAWDASFNVLQIGGTSSGGLRLLHSSGTDGIELYPPSTGGIVSLTLPPGSGGNGQSIVTDGAGNTSWATRVSSVTASSPLTSSGGSAPDISLTGTVPVANGGTGATTATGALTSLGAYPASNPNGYTSNTGTVTSVGGTGTVNGITLTGSVTTTGNLTLGGTLSNVSLATQVTGTLPVVNGGTGQTSYTDGQLLIGNTATGGLTKATLTAGSNISITNGNGSISIASTGSGLTIGSTGVTGATSGYALTTASGTLQNAPIREVLTAARTYYVGYDLGAVTANATTDKIEKTSHGLENGDPVVFTAATAPSGITLGAVYYVINKSTNDFEISTTVGGSKVTWTTNGTTVTCRTGNDSNIGYGTNSRTVALLTVQAFFDRVAGIDKAGYNITGTLCAGLFVATQTINVQTGVGSGRCILTGASNTTSIIQGKTQDMVMLADSQVGFQTGAFKIERDNAATTGSSVITLANHGLSAGDAVVFYGTAAPTNITFATTYYVISADLTFNSFKVASTVGGSAIAVGSGSVQVRRSTAFDVLIQATNGSTMYLTDINFGARPTVVYGTHIWIQSAQVRPIGNWTISGGGYGDFMLAVGNGTYSGFSLPADITVTITGSPAFTSGAFLRAQRCGVIEMELRTSQKYHIFSGSISAGGQGAAALNGVISTFNFGTGLPGTGGVTTTTGGQTN